MTDYLEQTSFLSLLQKNPFRYNFLENIHENHQKLLAEFDKNCQIEEISEFVDIFCLANRTGGNLVEVIETSGDIISGKIATDEEIEVILSAGKMECHIMMGIPFLIIMYIELTNKGFFTPLYHNVAGIIIMSICLMVYLAAVRISGRIISIRI